MAELVLQYSDQIEAELARLAEDNTEAKQIIVRAGMASGHPFCITFSEEIMELDVPQFKYLDYDKQKAAKFLLAQLEDIEHGRLEKMMRERAAWESLVVGTHVKPGERREDLQDPWKCKAPETGEEGQDESEDDRELEEFEALASAAGGPFPTIWEGVPAFQGFYNKHKTMHDKMTQTDAQYTAQLVSVMPPCRGVPGEKHWHFHNGTTTRGRSDKAEDEDKGNAKHKCRKKDEMPPPEEHQWREAIRRSREAAEGHTADSIPEWLRPFELSEISAEAASGSGANASN
jgi:hypothetical protein